MRAFELYQLQKLEASKMESTIVILVFYFAIAVVVGCLSHFTFRCMLFEFESKFGTLHKRTLEKQAKKKKTKKDAAALFGTGMAVMRFRRSVTKGPDQTDGQNMELRGGPTSSSVPATPRAHALHACGSAHCDF